MPRILEIKEIDGDIWVKVPFKDYEAEGGVHLYSATEMKSHDFGTRLVVLTEIEDIIQEKRKQAYV